MARPNTSTGRREITIEPYVRWAKSADLDDLLNLYQHLNPGDPEIENEAAARVWGEMIFSQTVRVVVGEVDGKAVSSCMLVIVPNLTRGGRPWSVIENVVTHAHYRRRGLGTAVLRFARSVALDANCYKVMLATGSSDSGTLHFYEKAGFSPVNLTCFEDRRL